MESEPQKTQQIEGTETFYSPRTPTPPQYAGSSYDVIPPPPPPNVTNPYEYANPYSVSMAPLPPSSAPKQRHRGLIVSIIGLLCLVIVLSGVLFTVLYQHNQKPSTVSMSTPSTTVSTFTSTLAPTATPTPIPTPTTSAAPTPTAVGNGVDAIDIFYRLQAQLLPPYYLIAGGYDTNWNNWPYTPERHAFTWHDNGVFYEAAAFGVIGNLDVSNMEAVADANYSTGVQGSVYDAEVDRSCLIIKKGKFFCCPAANDPYYNALASDPGCQ